MRRLQWFLLTLVLLCPAVIHAQAVSPLYIAKLGKVTIDSANGGPWLWTSSTDSSLQIKTRDSGGVEIFWPDSSKSMRITATGIKQTGSAPYRYYFYDSDTTFYIYMIDGTGSNDTLYGKFGAGTSLAVIYPASGGGGGGEVTSISTSVDNELVKFHNTSGDSLQGSTSNQATLSDAGLLSVPGGSTHGGAGADAVGIDSLDATRVKTRRVAADSVGAFGTESNPTIFTQDVLNPDDSGQAKWGTSALPYARMYLDTLYLNLGAAWWKISRTDVPGLGEQLTVAGSNTLDWQPAGSTGGEANTASNLAGNGIGVWKDKSGVDLRFKRLFSVSNLLTLADATDSVTFTINQGNFALSSIGGAITDAQVPNTITIDNATNAAQLGSVAAAEYLRRSGIVALTGDWAAGDFDITGLEALVVDSLRAVLIARVDSARIDTLWVGKVDPDTLHLGAHKVTAFGNGLTVSGSTLVVQADGDDLEVGASGIKIAQDGASSGQVLEWNGSAWEPGTDDAGGGGGDDTVTVLGDASSGPDDRQRWKSDSLLMEDLTANAQQLYLGSTTDRVQVLGDSGLTIGRTTSVGPFNVTLETTGEPFEVWADSVVADSQLHANAGGVYLGAHNFTGGTTSFAAGDLDEAEIAQGSLDSTELQNGGVTSTDIKAMTSDSLGRILSDENGTGGGFLRTTGASTAINFSSASLTLAANEIVSADIDWPAVWYFARGGDIPGQKGNTADSLIRLMDFTRGTSPNDTNWSFQDSSFDGDANNSMVAVINLYPPPGATTIDSIHIWRQTSTNDTSVVSSDSIRIDTSSTIYTQITNNRHGAAATSLATAGSDAIVLTHLDVNVVGANNCKPVKLTLYHRMDNASWIRYRIGVKYED